MTLTNSQMRDIETVIHPYTNLAKHRETGPMVIERGEGIYVWDQNGRKLIEGLSGLWCTALGYGNRELIEAATRQMERLSFAHVFTGKSHDPAIALAEKLKELSPVPVSKVFFCNSGSEANDTQVKLVRYMNNGLGRPKRKKIISRNRAYHGVTVAAASLTGLPANHTDFDLPIPGILHTDCPHHYRFAEEGESEEDFSTRLAGNLEEMILREGPETVAAFIAEPVMGAGGVIVPPEGYFAKIQQVLEKYDIFFIDDEVICGFGRTGNMFGAQTFDLAPDSISVAKALSSAYLPIAACMVSEDMYEAMLEESRKLGIFGHGYTYSGHPVACAVALKTLEIYERDDMVGHVRRVMPAFQERLTALGAHALVGETRGIGLMGGAEMVADKATKRPFEAKQGVGAALANFAHEEGVVVRAMGDVMGLCPPLIIGESEIHDMFDMIERSLDKTLAWVEREGLRAA